MQRVHPENVFDSKQKAPAPTPKPHNPYADEIKRASVRRVLNANGNGNGEKKQ